MSAADVEGALREIMETVDQSGHLLAEHKAGIRNAIVDPILWALDWSTWLPWECQPDYDLGRRRKVDYALFDGNGDIAVLIVVKHSMSRRRNDRIRLWQYTRGMTRGVGVLTYGFYWEVYHLSVKTRNIGHKRVVGLALDPAEPDGFQRVADALHHWLDRSNWPCRRRKEFSFSAR